MARLARKQSDGKYFHVMAQGLAGENIFSGDNCKGYYLTSIQKALRTKPVDIYAFCIMNNHVHLLLGAKNVMRIAEFMRITNSEYARYYNSVNNRAGYVFRDRFKSEIISNSEYLLNCLAYIHYNPVKAKLVSNAKDYKYSSLNDYLNKKGIVTFAAAQILYDTGPENIAAIMKEKRHSGFWIEDDNLKYEKYDDVLDDIADRDKVSLQNVNDSALIGRLTKELMQRSGLSLRKTAEVLKISKDKVRRAWINHNLRHGEEDGR
jgi:REP element-mobilizing transposase RayT